MFVVPHTVRPRRAAENVFEALFALCMVVNIAGFVIAFADFYDRQNNTFKRYFGTNVEFNFSSPLNIIFENCSYTASVTVGSVTAASTLDARSAPFGFLLMTDVIMAIFILHGLLIVVQLIGLGLSSGNIRHFRIGGSFIPMMVIAPCTGVCLAVALIALIWGTDGSRKFYNDFVDVCAAQYIAFNQDLFLQAEYDTNVVFGVNLNWIFAPVVIYIGFVFFGCLHHVAEGMRAGYVALAKSMYPWESGFLCASNKSRLGEWTRRRARLMESLEKGLLTLVSPFPQFSTATGALFSPGASTVHRQPPSIGSGYQMWPGLDGRGVRGGQRNVVVEFPPVVDGAGDEEGEPYVPGEDADGVEWGEATTPPVEIDGAPDEVSEQPRQKRRHRHRHRHHRRDDAGAEMPAEEEGGEDGSRRHRRRRTRAGHDSGDDNGNPK